MTVGEGDDARRAPADDGEARGPETAARAGVDWGRLATLDEAVGRDVVADIVTLGLDEVPAMLANLREATDDALAGRAHALKSVLGNLGMTAAFEACQSIETAARAGEPARARSMLATLGTEADRALAALRAAYGDRDHPPGRG